LIFGGGKPLPGPTGQRLPFPCPNCLSPFTHRGEVLMSLSLPQWPYAVTLEEAIQTVITARQQYHLVHTQVQQLREAWASQYVTLLYDEALQKQTVHQVETGY
jgi:hypothetical protein